MSYHVETVSSLKDVRVEDWNNLLHDNNPFLRYEFLAGLEQHGCLRKDVGWQPLHFLLKDSDQKLQGAIPAYLKYNSFGEFVFDWSWASAYEQHGLSYYPKLVTAIPFTPVTGPRILACSSQKNSEIKQTLINAAKSYIQQHHISGLHSLFPDAEDLAAFNSAGMMSRLQYQYHWQNNDYEDFEHFLSFFRSRKRNNTRQERQSVYKTKLTTRVLHGDEIDDTLWHSIYSHYQSTFLKKGNYPALSLNFFKHLGDTMGQSLVVMLAELDNKAVAAAINLRSDTHLYGRYWGCDERYHNLHFELCFYMGIEYCIQHGIQTFEPGAQGEHKISRGFLPTETWSAHWIAEPQFSQAIDDFLQREQYALKKHRHELENMSPFRHCEES